MSKLSNVVNNDVVKKTMYNKLVTKVNIDTTGFVLKTKYDTDKSDLEKKISDAEGKIPRVSGLVTNSALTTVENKIPDVSNLVKKTDCNTKISEIENKVNYHDHDKYITASEFNKLTTENFKARLAQADLVITPNFDTKLKNLDKIN